MTSAIPRSQSSSCLSPTSPSAKDKFLNHEPLLLASAASLDLPSGEKKPGTGWSDSEDEGVVTSRSTKKIKATTKIKSLKLSELAQAPDADALRSPFEEKSSMGY
jgi:hypothetical protein